jgi:hypothetical protein
VEKTYLRISARAGLLVLLSSCSLLLAVSALGAKECAEDFNALHAQVAPDLEHPEIVDLPLQPIDQKVLKAVQNGTPFSYVVDTEGKSYAVPGALPFKTNGLQVARVRDAKGGEVLVPVRESGEIKFDPTAKKFSFTPSYSLAAAPGEREGVLANLKKQNPGAEIGLAEGPGVDQARVLDCNDLLTRHLNLTDYHFDRITTRLALSTVTLAIKDHDVRTRYENDPESFGTAERKLYLYFGVDTFRRYSTTYANGIVGKYIVEKDAEGFLHNYAPRLATGFTSNTVAKEITDAADPLVKKAQKAWQESASSKAPKSGGTEDKKLEITPTQAWEIWLYNNGTTAVSVPLGKYADEKVKNVAPYNFFDACSQGKKLRFVVSPRMMRVYESGVLTLIGLPKYYFWGI